jgi:hypothetical protein
MNRGQIANECLAHQFNDTKYRPLMEEWINEGQNRIAREADIRALFTSVSIADTSHEVSLPVDFARLIEVSDATDGDNWTPLVPMELRDFDDASVVYSNPTFYVVAGEILYLFPYPADERTIALNYYRLPAAMESDADVPEIPADYHSLLVYYALWRGFQRENDYEAAGYWRNEFDAGLMKMRGELQYDTAAPPTQVPGLMDEVPDLRWH